MEETGVPGGLIVKWFQSVLNVSGRSMLGHSQHNSLGLIYQKGINRIKILSSDIIPSSYRDALKVNWFYKSKLFMAITGQFRMLMVMMMMMMMMMMIIMIIMMSNDHTYRFLG